MECNICGEALREATNEAALLHMATRHPLELVTSEPVRRMLTPAFYRLGARLAEKFFK